jgi:hypothetical protein
LVCEPYCTVVCAEQYCTTVEASTSVAAPSRPMPSRMAYTLRLAQNSGNTTLRHWVASQN